jgi:curli biogenesis system outer membrane secretion channel CsgG
MNIVVPILLVLLAPQQAAPNQNTKEPGKLPPYTGPKKRAAVPGFASKVDVITVAAVMPSGQAGSTTIPLDMTGPMGIGTGMSDMLNTALINSQRFVVLERQDLKDVLDELGPPPTDPVASAGGGIISATGGATVGTPLTARIDPTTAAKPGKLLGAQILIRGSLTELSYGKSQRSAGGGILSAAANQESVSFTAICAIDLKVIEVDTGRILDSVRAEGKAESKAKILDLEVGGVHFGQQKFEASPLAKAIRNAIENGVKLICKRVDAVPWEARIALVSEKDGKKTLYLNFGADVGIKSGTELEIFRPGAIVVDPQTSVVIGREDDTVLGKCVVRSSTKTMTVASLLTDAPAALGDGIRLVNPPKEGGQ